MGTQHRILACTAAGLALCAALIAVPEAPAAKDDTVLVSRETLAEGGFGGDAASTLPSISADGRFVAFESQADNLSSADDNAVENVFVRDLETGVTTLVSRQSAADGGAGANGDSRRPWISADGRFVAFDSDADNLSAADDNAVGNVFVRDLQAGVTTRARARVRAGRAPTTAPSAGA